MAKFIDKMYKDAQAACGLAIGDWVKVVDKLHENALEWQGWDSANMDKTVGMVGKISSIASECIYVVFEELERGYFYPYFVLEKTGRPCPFKIGDYVKVMRWEPMSREIVGKFPRWAGLMDRTLGKVGKVTKIDFDNFKEVVGVKIPEEGRAWTYAWDCLEKVEKPAPAHEFKPFEPVLIRNNNDSMWFPTFFVRYEKDNINPYITMGSGYGYNQCIPYEGNEHLCGTSNSPEE